MAVWFREEWLGLRPGLPYATKPIVGEPPDGGNEGTFRHHAMGEDGATANLAWWSLAQPEWAEPLDSRQQKWAFEPHNQSQNHHDYMHALHSCF